MKYQALAESLRPVADAVASFLRQEEGATRFKVEKPLEGGGKYGPTLQALCPDGSLIAIEVNEGGFTTPLDAFVLECQRNGVPVRLFVAAPLGAPAQALLDLHRFAKSRGIGVLEVDGTTVTRHIPALRLSLTGLRAVNRKRFPRRIGQHLVGAEETFRNGDPAKGCTRVYDVVERCSRRLCVDVKSKNLWKRSLAIPGHQDEWYERSPWAGVLKLVADSGDWRAIRSVGIDISDALWSQIRGLTGHRNETGHEPTSLRALQSRDTKLRTRFEHAVDTLDELLEAYPGCSKGMP
jgi:hypothetical protein